MSLIRTVATKCITLPVKRCFSTSLSLNTRKVAVVLSGSGVYDGSEIHEASAILVHLTRHKAEPLIYAPDAKQMHVIDHKKGEPSTTESRNVLVESARIARGNIKPLTELNVASHDAVVFPGGFGVAKNLSSFAVDGANCKVIPEVEQVIKSFHAAKKPIALCCIAPTLAAKVLGKVEITLGQEKDDGSGMWPYCESVQAATSWGAIHHNCKVDEVVVDKNNLVVTTPAFMYATTNFHEIHEGVGKMIDELLRLLKA